VVKVLIADDSLVTRKMLEGTLEKNGYQTVAVEDGMQAWEVLKSDNSLRLAILDWMIPGMDGIDICRRLQEQERTRSVYVILLTAKEGVDNTTAALQAGASDYITKPFEKEELLARLKVGERTVNLQLQLAQSQKMESIGQLAAGIAHEINTPAQYVGDNIRFVQESFNDIKEILEKYGRLLEAGKKNTVTRSLVDEMSKLIEEKDIAYLTGEIPKAIKATMEGIDKISGIIKAMKDFAHPGVENKVSIKINDAIETTIAVAHSKWNPVATLERRYAADIPPVFGYPAELNQSILNVIINAAEAIGKVVGSNSQNKGKITIETRCSKAGVEIRICDTGGGIEEAISDKVFNPFFTTKTVGQGTGQGLSTAHSIITGRHGGTITFETEKDKGTTFIICLPCETTSEKVGEKTEVAH